MINKRYHFKEIDSTNKKAKELAGENCPHGTLVSADAQNAGVGRRGRSWSSEENTGIYMSMVLRPEMDANQASMLTLVAAISVAKAIEAFEVHKKASIQIKWPNDILLNKKKICGILTEMTLAEMKIDAVIIGIGINVTNQIFPEEIADTASSILIEAGVEIDRELLIKEVWKQFAVYYEMFLQTKDLQMFREEYELFLVNKEKQVKVLDPAGEYTGVAKGITSTGELLVETETGMQQVSSGEVSVRGIYGYV